MTLPAPLTQKLPDFVEQFISAIGLVEFGDDRDPPGLHHGTGSFLHLGKNREILTCEHVAKIKNDSMLVMTQFGSEFGISIANPFVSWPYPVDAAVSKITENSWSKVPHLAKCLEKKMFAKRHDPVEGEFLYVYGFPGEDAVVSFGEHVTRGMGLFAHGIHFSSVEVEEEPKPQKEYHFFIPFNPEMVVLVEGQDPVLSLPPGMSGSLVWNSRYLEVTNEGKEWVPEDARITGIVWGHSSKAGVLIATKVEHFFELLGQDVI